MKKQLKHTYNKFNNVIKKFKNKMEKWLEKLQDKIDKWIKKLNNKIEKLQEKKDKWIKKFKNKMKKWCRKKNNSKDKKENVNIKKNEIINAIKQYRNRIERFKIEDDRKQEIEYAKQKLIIGKVLLNGKRGSGKTAIAKAIAKSLNTKFFEINLINMSVSDITNNHILKYLNWRGKFSYFTTLESLNKFFIKWFLLLPIPSIITIIYSFYFSHYLWFVLILLLIFPFILWVISWVIFKIFYKFHKKKQTILISEINFLKKEKLKNIEEILWKIIKIYKNDHIILESTDSIPEHLSDKYNMNIVEVNNGSNFNMPIKQAFKEIRELVNKSKEDEISKLYWKNEYEYIESRKYDIWNILKYLSFREIKILGEEVISNFIYFKGEINIWDYINVFYLRKKNKKLLNELIKIDITKYHKKNESYNIFININFKQIIEELKIKKIIFNNDVLSQKIIENIYSMTNPPCDIAYLNLKKRKFLFAEKKHHSKYLNIGTYNYLHNDFLNLFFNEPVKFVLKVSRKKVKYKEFDISNEDCIKFVEKIIKCDINVYDKEEQKNFIEKIDLILNWIYFSRENSKTFYEKLSSVELRLVFFILYFEYNDQRKIENVIKKQQYQVKSKKIFVKNIPLIFNIRRIHRKDKLFEIKDYLKFLKKEKCDAQIAYTFYISKNFLDNTNKEFYFLDSGFLDKKLIKEVKQIILNFDKKANIFYSDENKKIRCFEDVIDRTKLISEDILKIEYIIKNIILIKNNFIEY